MAGVALSHLDHFVMPCTEVEAMAAFYVRVLGMRRESFGDGRVALHFGRHKINLHHAGHETVLRAPNHLAGTQDFCLIADTPVADVRRHLEQQGVAVIEGPVQRSGAAGSISSVYFRDPEGNLVEIANYP